MGVSGHIEEHYVQRALDAGMNLMVGKPASVNDIKEAICDLKF